MSSLLGLHWRWVQPSRAPRSRRHFLTDQPWFENNGLVIVGLGSACDIPYLLSLLLLEAVLSLSLSPALAHWTQLSVMARSQVSIIWDIMNVCLLATTHFPATQLTSFSLGCPLCPLSTVHFTLKLNHQYNLTVTCPPPPHILVLSFTHLEELELLQSQ